MKTKEITKAEEVINVLNELRINVKKWEKGTITRYYIQPTNKLDIFKTNKMKVTAYFYENDGEIALNVYTDCPNQPYAFAKSHNEKVESAFYSVLEAE